MSSIYRRINHWMGEAIKAETAKERIPLFYSSLGAGPYGHYLTDISWYKIYNSDAARVITSMPYASTTLSNYAEPLFRLWNDLDWHRNSNQYTAAMARA